MECDAPRDWLDNVWMLLQWCALNRCRDSILYRLVLAYFMAHDHWASQHNITIMYPGHFPALALSSHCCASSHSIAHLRVSSWFSVHHHRSIHPLSSQFLGVSHSIYYYICLCLASYNYYFVMDPYITSFTYLEHSRFASEPWEGAYVRLRVAMSVFTTELLAVTIYHQLVPCSACICRCSP
jgi:hypothetical protein